MVEGWRLLGSVGRERLAGARLAAHHAAQVLWSAGNALVAPRPDDSHTSFSWDGRHDRFLGEPAESGLRVALTPRDATVHLLGEGDESLAAMPLAGRTLREALATLDDAIAAAGVSAPASAPPDYDLPAHPVPDGRFEPPDIPAVTELCGWFHDAQRTAEATRAATPGAAPVRVWPHHFDIATLVSLDAERSVNVGLSPGDEGNPAPYFYVTPWPRPEGDPPPAPGAGRWHTEGWLGAVLDAEKVTELAVAGAQRERVEEFVEAAVAACRRLLERKESGR